MHDPIAVVRAFIECINARDVEEMCALMTPDHAMVDPSGFAVSGAERIRQAWQMYFSWFPDYQITPEHIFGEGDRVALFGRASATYAPDGKLHKDNRWEIPAAWLATVRDGRVSVWRVYADNQRARDLMNTRVPTKAANG